MPTLDISGQRYGRLTAVAFSHVASCRHMWICSCECGNDIIARKENLRSGNTKSCGCLIKDDITARSFKHGGSRRGSNRKPLYRVWSTMRDRCNNPKNANFKNYGGRGIFVCERWNLSFESFAKDVGERPSSDHSIDRIDDDGPYAPGNVRWATHLEQRHNQRRCRKIPSAAAPGETAAAAAS